MYPFYPHYGYGTGLLFSRCIPYIVCYELCCYHQPQPQQEQPVQQAPFKGGKG